MVDLSTINSQLSTNSNPPQGTVCAELGDFARGPFAAVNGDTNHADKRAGKDERNQPGGDMPEAEGMVKRHEIVNRRGGVQEYFRQPRNQDQNENEHVIAFQPAPDRLELRDLEARQD